MQQLKTFYSFLLLALGLTSFSANGQTWTPMGIPGGTIRAITEYNGEVIVAGTFDLGGGLKGIAKWNTATSSWDSLGSGLPSGKPIYALAVYNGELYVGGDFDLGGNWPGIQRGIRKWDGLSWSSVGTSGVGSPGGDHSVNSLAVYNGELYAAGRFSHASWTSANNIVKWNGTSWSAVGGGINVGMYDNLPAMYVHKGELFIGSSFGTVTKWDGTALTTIGTFNNPIFALESFNGDLIAGGCFNSGGGIAANHIAKWDGSTWSALGSGIDSGLVDAMTVYDGALYVGGIFWSAGDFAANHIAKWDGSAWSQVGSGTDNQVITLAPINGELYVGGIFSSAGGTASGRIAKLVPCTLAPAQPGPINSNVVLCEGNPLIFSVTAPPSEVYTYTWTLPQGWAGASSGNIINVTPGISSGNITVTATNNCGSNIQTLTVNPFPVSPISISQAGNVLVASPNMASYQWYLNDNLIPGATSQSYISSQDGSYHVVGTDANGCTAKSNYLSFLLDIKHPNPAKDVNLYPNPTTGAFTIEGSVHSISEELSFQVMDLTGRVIQRGMIAANNNHFKGQVQLHQPAPGMYILKLKGELINVSYPFAIK